ncbi:hypothetical protein Hdeb2414_s0003g00102371 [Helianthus debilis subsp. tardiflorus]
MPDNFPAYSSMDSPWVIRNASNSLLRVCNRAFCTLSAPKYLILNDSPTSFAVFFFETCNKTSSGIAWNKKARASLLFFSSTTAPSCDSMDSQRP